MTELLTSAQMRAIEQACFDSGGATGLDLMERAGCGVVESVFDTWPEMAQPPGRGLVLCGPGNNGGDGFVIARLLAERGWTVSCLLLGDPARLPSDARVNHDRWTAIGPTDRLTDVALAPAPDLVIDALFGTGLTRPMPAPVDAALREMAIAWPEARWVAVDAPSGLCMDSGRVLGADRGATLPHRADLTVSFHRLKLGHVLAEGPGCCGMLRVADIGLADAASGVARLTQPNASALAKGAVGGGGHKYDHGHALVLSGGAGRTGAARLAARAALRVGAGLVTLAAPPPAMAECAAQLTAIMLTGCHGAAELGSLLGDDRLNALCLGPGLGIGPSTRELVITALGSRRACVLDADALTAFATDPPRLFSLLHRRVVLTPHGGEFGRLFPDLQNRLVDPAATGPAYSRLDAARDAAARAGCVVLLKGPDTVIADPEATLVINAAHDTPWLATAGSGDVLAGLIAGLLARRFDPLDAAGTGAWLHAEAARTFGPGLIAEDIPEEIPNAFRSLNF